MSFRSKQSKTSFSWKIAAIALLLPLAGFAQDKNMISLTGGYSLPLGSFASKQFSDPEAGLAGDGIYGQLSYERRIGSWWGLRLTGSLNENQTNADPLIEEYSVFLPNPDTYTWESTVTKWRLGAVLLGPSTYLSLGRLTLEGHVQAGAVFVCSPGVALLGTSSTNKNPVDGRISAASTKAFGYGAGASARLRLVDHLHLQVTGDWIGARATLKDVPTYVKVGDFPPVVGGTDRERFAAVINFGAGLVFSF